MTYYNDIDPNCILWLRDLMGRGLLSKGILDNRSVKEVTGEYLSQFDRVHLFAGIGGWSLALDLAGWPEEWPVWTGSCPCQPFSRAGARKGESDSRHVWPEMYRLVRECRPTVVLGEQVSGPDGRRWLSRVRADLEGTGYAFGAADLPACSVSAPHWRSRLYWCAVNKVDHPHDQGRQQHGRGGAVQEEHPTPQRPGDLGRCWGRYDILSMSDGKYRRVEPGTLPLADGFPGRTLLLRGYGNAIVPQQAALFIRAVIGAVSEGAGH